MVVMEHVKDGALDSYLAKRGRWLCISEKVRMCLDAASGLEYLHKMGCIHRDVSARLCSSLHFLSFRSIVLILK